MATRRFLPDVKRTRRGFGWALLALGLLGLGGCGWLPDGWRRINVTGAVMLAFPLSLLLLGLYLALRRKQLFDDVEGRSYRLIQDGKATASGRLDELGPLRVLVERRMGTGDGARTRVRYLVRPAAHGSIDLYDMPTAGKARLKMDALGRAWGLSCQSLGGQVRAAADLGKPLHERLRHDREARAAMPLPPEAGLRIEPLSPGYQMLSTHRSWTSLAGAALVPVAAAYYGLRDPSRVVSFLEEGRHDPLTQVLAAGMALVLLAMLWIFFQALREALFPGVVRITHEGVAFRGSRMRFDEIEEVTATNPVELVGGRKVLALSESFCRPKAAKVVAHELQRLILEVGSSAPLG